MWDRQRVPFPIWVIYRRPRDFPAHFVARCWDMDKPTDKYLLGRSLEDVRDLLPDGLSQIDRSPTDDPCIVESWL